MKKKIEKTTWVKICVVIAIVVAILVLDLVMKYVFDAIWKEGSGTTVIPGLFNFVLKHNHGAGFSILEGKTAFLIAISVVFLGIFTWYFCKEKKKTWLLCVAYAFLVGGCLGNMYDRIVLGYVRDFIQFDFWQSFPIFNFADVFLTFGVVLFVIYMILYFVSERKNSKKIVEIQSVEKETLDEDSKVELDENLKSLDEKCKKIDEKTAKKAKKIEKTRNKQQKKAESETSEEDEKDD